MPGKEYTKTEDQASQAQASQPTTTEQAPDMQTVSTMLAKVFATFEAHLLDETPNVFSENAKTAVATFSNIVARLRLDPPPRAIQDLRGNRLSSTEIQLTWTDAVGNSNGYKVKRCQGKDCKDFVEIKQILSSERSFHDVVLSSNISYRYQLVAFNSRGETPSNISEVPAFSTYPAEK